jgi:hypothetical protein
MCNTNAVLTILLPDSTAKRCQLVAVALLLGVGGGRCWPSLGHRQSADQRAGTTVVGGLRTVGAVHLHTAVQPLNNKIFEWSAYSRRCTPPHRRSAAKDDNFQRIGVQGAHFKIKIFSNYISVVVQ